MTSEDPRPEDERIGAFVDDEMTPEEADAFARALGEDPALAREVDIQDRLRSKLRASHVIATPAPDAIMRLLQEPRPVVVPLRPWVRTAIPAGLGFALAASIALAVGLSQGLFHGGSAGDVVISKSGTLVAQGGLGRALDQGLGTDAPGRFRLVESFKTADGRYCRIFRAQNPAESAGLACKAAGTWTIASLASPAKREASDYRQAGSSLPRAVVAAMADLNLSEPLSADQEKTARAAGWSAR